MAAVAAEIRSDRRGRPSVADPARRRHVLGLRGDPRLSALMAAELARENRARLERALGRRVEAVDLYMAHFLGARGATEFLLALKHTPDAPGPSLLPAAARANRNVFYDGGPHRPRSLRQIFTAVAARMERA